MHAAKKEQSRDRRGVFKGGVPLGATTEYSEIRLESKESKPQCLSKGLP